MAFDEKLLKTMMEHLHEGVYFVDTDRTIQYWNSGAERITGYPRIEVVGTKCSDDVLDHVDADGKALCDEGCPLQASLVDGEKRRAEVFLKHKDGHRVPVVVYITPLQDDRGSLIGGMESFHDNHAVGVGTGKDAGRDADGETCPLTGLGTRKYAKSVFERCLMEARIRKTQVGVVLLGIDDLVQYNKFGWNVGDVVLKMVSRTLANALRPNDSLARWTGTEFVVILPDVGHTNIESHAERLRALVAQSSREASQGRIEAAVSVGATATSAGDTVKIVMGRLEKLLATSREQGGNRVTKGSW